MFRKMITLLLFTTTVPYAAFGEHRVDITQVRSWLSEANVHARDKWPAARGHLAKNLPDAVLGTAARLNAYSPSAGGGSSCMPVGLSPERTTNQSVPIISI